MASEYVYKLEDYLNKRNSLRNLAKKFAEDATKIKLTGKLSKSHDYSICYSKNS
jgi:hypothetical protein